MRWRAALSMKYSYFYMFSSVSCPGSLQTTSLCLISGVGDLLESCNGDDEGLVIPALDDESDL